MKDFIRENRAFFLPYLVFLSIGGLIILLFPKTEIHLFINQHHHFIADTFFKIITHLGDGILIAIVILLFLFMKYRYAIVVALSNIFITLVVQAFKRYILPEITRPVLVFAQEKDLHLVDGITIFTDHSFPSGHSATAFSLYLMFALICRNKSLKLVSFFVAFLIAFSRMYLSQHFLIDIYFGSLIGAVFTSVFFFWSEKWNSPKLNLSLQDAFKINKHVKQE